jgi:hypothetical protein
VEDDPGQHRGGGKQRDADGRGRAQRHGDAQAHRAPQRAEVALGSVHGDEARHPGPNAAQRQDAE